MTDLQVFRDAVLADARDEAARLLAEADDDGRRQVRDAEDRAAEIRDRAGREGRATERRRLQRLQAETRRRAREEVLRARRAGLERLRAGVLARLQDATHAGDLAALTSRCEAVAREQLGDGVQVEVADGGGVVARAGDRLVDYRLASLVDMLIEDMGSDVQELWR